MTNQKEAKAGAQSPQQQQRLAVGVKTAAGMLSVSASKLWGMIAKNEIPCIRLGGRTLIRTCDLEITLTRAASVQEAHHAP
jgi:excisionase family DNA binding protein